MPALPDKLELKADALELLRLEERVDNLQKNVIGDKDPARGTLKSLEERVSELEKQMQFINVRLRYEFQNR